MVSDRDRSRGRPAATGCARRAVRATRRCGTRSPRSCASGTAPTIRSWPAEPSTRWRPSSPRRPDRPRRPGSWVATPAQSPRARRHRQVSATYPQALRAAVVRWGELDIAEPMFAAITAGQLDAWVFRPQIGIRRGFPPRRHRAAERVGQPERGGVRGGAADRRTVVAPVHRAAGHVHPQPRADRFLRRRARHAGRDLLDSLGLVDPELPVVVLRFRPNRPVLTNPNAIADRRGVRPAGLARATSRRSTSP